MHATPVTTADDNERSRRSEAATREILDLISRSRDDERPVFQAVLQRAADLCRADAALLVLGQAGDIFQRLASHLGLAPGSIAVYERGEVSMDPDVSIAARAILSGRTIHIPDMIDTDGYRNGVSHFVSAVRDTGVRSQLFVPLVTPHGGVGCILLYRKEMRPFTPDEITLVETFGTQAVIAIENARQFRALQERLARETATGEILSVISRSPDDDQPVFETIVENALRLCEARMTALILATPQDRLQRLVAHRGISDETVEMFRSGRMPVEGNTSYAARAILEGRVIQFDDMGQSDLYVAGSPVVRAMVDQVGIRSVIFVPLMARDGAIGAITVFRYEVRPFDDRTIGLIESFAAQAVIAIENVRQFRELQGRLEREAATRDILEVISQSRDDDTPVFDAILRSAARLCSSPMAWLLLADDARTTMRLAGYHGDSRRTIKIGDEWPIDPATDPRTGLGGVQDDGVLRAFLEARTIQDEDMALTPHYLAGDASMRQLVDEEGLRTRLSVPLVSGGKGIGVIVLSRREVAPFGPEDIALLDTFAEQAVIAIENVRQFRELQTRLEREKASAEILEVISQSRDDEKPVFDVILRHAADLCGAHSAALALGKAGDSHQRLLAHRGISPATVAVYEQGKVSMNPDISPTARAILTGKVIHIPDMMDTDGYRSGIGVYVSVVRDTGVRTELLVPLVTTAGGIGCIIVFRTEVRPFTPDEIALVESFAAQAVIAIENVRQFRELQTRLEREAATRNILRVISESPDDEQPTFEAILDSATRLCGTQYASIILGRKGDTSQRMVAHRGAMEETVAIFREGRVPMDPEDSFAARAILEGRTIHLPDMADTDQYRAGHERFRLVVDRQGLRTNLFVPLLGPEGGIGCFVLWKKEVAPFTADQIALMETFASHAVIAIENVRQFRALEALNAELGDRVQAQVGEIERMGRLKRFLPAAVADAVVSSGSEKMLKSHRALLGVLFCDIRGFTAFCETAEPEETIEVLQTYHDEMGRLIEAHGAGVDHRMGDGIMVLFNDPLPCDDPAGAAVRLGVAMRARMAELSLRWKKMGHRLGFGVGISLGYATVGMVGSGGRFDYTASGTVVNVAARLCDEALDGEILLSQRAATAVEDGWQVEPRGTLGLKGIRAPVEVFRVAGPTA